MTQDSCRRAPLSVGDDGLRRHGDGGLVDGRAARRRVEGPGGPVHDGDGRRCGIDGDDPSGQEASARERSRESGGAEDPVNFLPEDGRPVVVGLQVAVTDSPGRVERAAALGKAPAPHPAPPPRGGLGKCFNFFSLIYKKFVIIKKSPPGWKSRGKTFKTKKPYLTKIKNAQKSKKI